MRLKALCHAALEEYEEARLLLASVADSEATPRGAWPDLLLGELHLLEGDGDQAQRTFDLVRGKYGADAERILALVEGEAKTPDPEIEST